MSGTAAFRRSSFLLLLVAACFRDSFSPPGPEVCKVPRGWWARPTACARLVGTVVDEAGRPVSHAFVGYAVKDRTRETDGVILSVDADARGNFLITAYRRSGRATNPDTATLNLFASNVSPKRVAQGLETATPRWIGVSEAVVTFVRVGSALTVESATIVVNRHVTK
jgi:hypothetical protein